MTEKEQQILLGIARAVIPAGQRLPSPGPRSIEQIAAYLEGGGDAVLRGYKGLLWAAESNAWLQRRRSFASMTEDEAGSLLDEWRRGNYVRRNLLRVLTMPLKVAHYSDPEFYRSIGCVWRRPTVSEPRPRWMTERHTSAAELAGETLECDAVVIGTGAGGAVAAKELAEAGLAVVMLEEGQYYTREHFSGDTIDVQRKMYRDAGATFTVGNTHIWMPVGVSVGGSTTINSGTCFRTPERVLAGWRRNFGLREFSSDTMAPYYERVESVLRVEPARREVLGGVARVIARGCDVLGYSHKPLARNAPDCDGQGMCCFGCPTDAKRSTNVSYVPLAMQRGATLVTGARADRILVENGRAVGVVAKLAGERDRPALTVRARAVVVACGSIYTPLFLQKNRVGNASGQLGKNLSIHPASGMFALFDERIDGYNAVPQGYSIDQFAEEGLLFEGAFTPPDVGAVGITMIGRRFVDLMESFERLAVFGFMIEDTSRGTVRAGPGGRPLVTYMLNDHDLARLKRGAEILARVFLRAGARHVFPCIHGFDELSSDNDLARFRRARLSPRDLEISAYHPLGTARMGVSAATSVIGSDQQLHDLPGCYVMDGSAVPSSLAVNPQVTIMALATRAAERLATRLS